MRLFALDPHTAIRAIAMLVALILGCALVARARRKDDRP